MSRISCKLCSQMMRPCDLKKHEAAHMKVVFKNVHLPEEIRDEAEELAEATAVKAMTDAFQKSVGINQSKTPAHIKNHVRVMLRQEFNKEFTPEWEVIVGRECDLNGYITHRTPEFIYFNVGPVEVIIFKRE